MTTDFPTGLDSFTNPAATDAMNDPGVKHDEQHANLNDAVEALEAKVGIDASADATSLDNKVANKQPLDADLTALAGLNSATSGAIASDGAGWIKKTYAQFKTALGLAKADVGLGNVDNTSDANKPISTATQSALDAKQALDSDLTALAGLDSSTSGAIASDGSGWIKKTYAQLKTALGLVKGDVGLGNVDNTSDATKNAAAATLTNKTLTSPVINSPTGLVKGDVGLGNVDNTSDASKPVSTAAQTALDLKQSLSAKAQANGYASLGADGKVPSGQLPTFAGITDHGDLDGLSDDDHSLYALADGSRGDFEASGAVAAHEAASPAHDAADVSLTPFGTIAATNVQAAIEEVVAEASGGISQVQDEGSDLPSQSNINFTGAGVTASDDAANGRTNVAIPGFSGVEGHVIKDAGSAETQRANLDFQDGFIVTDNSGADSTDVDIDYGTATELTDLDSGAEAAGTSDKVARADHKHNIANDAITFAKMQNSSAASKILGRGSASGAGDFEEITLGTGLTMSGTTLNGTAAGVGDLLDWQFVRKTADESVTSSATLQNDDHLLLAIGANQTWIYEWVLFATGNSAGDLAINITKPAGATLLGGLHGPALNSPGADGDMTTDARALDDASVDRKIGTTSITQISVIRAIVINGANAGNVTLQWCQVASNGAATTLFTNSYMVGRRVA